MIVRPIRPRQKNKQGSVTLSMEAKEMADQFSLKLGNNELATERLDKAGITYEFDRAVDRLSRLYHFANSLPPDDELATRGERLAKDDLLNFAIHFRRLLSLSDGIALAKNALVPMCSFRATFGGIARVPTLRGDNVWKIINTIIHHDLLQLISLSTHVQLLFFRKSFPNVDMFEPQTFFPVLFVKSDRVPFVCVELRYLVEQTFSRVVDPLVDTLAERELFLELFYREQ